MARPLKIANASGFWGDQPDAAARLVAQQWAWGLGLFLLATWLWRRGVRRYEAFGG